MTHDQRPQAAPPTPHARKRPNITISMLEALKAGYDDPFGIVGGDRGVQKALVKRGLSFTSLDTKKSHITRNGELLIETQYEALKKVLPDHRTTAR